jgi:hypothetical protein
VHGWFEAPSRGHKASRHAELAVAAARDHGIRVRVEPDGVEVLDEHRARCGESVLTADVIVCAAGDVPNTEWLAGSGLALDAGGGLAAPRVVAAHRITPGAPDSPLDQRGRAGKSGRGEP